MKIYGRPEEWHKEVKQDIQEYEEKCRQEAEEALTAFEPALGASLPKALRIRFTHEFFHKLLPLTAAGKTLRLETKEKHTNQFFHEAQPDAPSYFFTITRGTSIYYFDTVPCTCFYAHTPVEQRDLGFERRRVQNLAMREIKKL